jgi:hypothetical protein
MGISIPGIIPLVVRTFALNFLPPESVLLTIVMNRTDLCLRSSSRGPTFNPIFRRTYSDCHCVTLVEVQRTVETGSVIPEPRNSVSSHQTFEPRTRNHLTHQRLGNRSPVTIMLSYTVHLSPDLVKAHSSAIPLTWLLSMVAANAAAFPHLGKLSSATESTDLTSIPWTAVRRSALL